MHILDANEIFGTTFYTFDRIMELGGKNGPDAFALYVRYIKQSRIQETNKTWSEDKFMMEGLGWGVERFRKAKSILKKLGLIDAIQIRNQDGTLGKKLVRTNFLINENKIRNNSLEYEFNLTSEKPTLGKRETNAYIYNINALSIKNKKDSLRSPEALQEDDGLNREENGKQTHSERDEKKVEKCKKKIETYDDIKQLKDDQWRSFNKMALRCLDYMMQLGYRIDYTEKALDDYIQRLRDKARDYNLKLPSGEINWGEIVKRVGSWKSYHEEKGDKIKIYKTSVEKFFR